MLVENQYFKVKWNARTRQWYEGKGYQFTKTNDEFIVKAEDLSLGSKQKVKVQCDYCQRIIDVAYRDYVRYKDNKYSCMRCRQTKTSENTLLVRQEYLYNAAKELCDKMGYILLTKKEDILNSESRVDYLCPKHGIRNAKVYSMLLGHGCLKCLHDDNIERQKHKTADVIELGNLLGITIVNPEEYIDYYAINLKCICNKCGDIYLTSYQLLSQEKCLICPKCSKAESHGETKVRLYLEKCGIDFVPQKRFDDCRTTVPLPFDFYIPEFNTIVEYDGEGHYYPVDFGGHDGTDTFERTVQNDAIKNQYCKKHNIELIRIPYWDYDNIEKILDEKLFTQRYSLVS